MAWLRIDDGFAEHPKIVALSERARWLHVTALCYCARKLTDGRLDARSVNMLIASVARPCKQAIVELVEGGLWTAVGDGFQVKDYLDWNPSAAQVKVARQRNADRQAKHRDNANSNAVTDRVTESVSNDAPSQTPVVVELSALPRDVGGLDEKLWKRLTIAAGARTPSSIRKLERTILANRCSERDLVCAIDAATGPGVRDPLGVALSELKNPATERSAA